ncbi:MAG: hypothetical protein Q9171_001687 [Xanthocarpia ochracea]
MAPIAQACSIKSSQPPTDPIQAHLRISTGTFRVSSAGGPEIRPFRLQEGLTVFTLLSFVLVCTGATTFQYVIYPLSTIDLRSAVVVRDAIDDLVEDKRTIYTSQPNPRFPPIFWVASLTVDAAAQLKRHPKVDDVALDKIGGKLFDSPRPPNISLQATPTYSTQYSPAATELRVISQPSGDPDLSKYSNYVFPSLAGRDTFIYHVEMGINADHDEFRDRYGEWVFTGLAILAGQNTKNESPVSAGHSTCTVSKASGKLYGAAKFATLVVVKMPDLSEKSMLEVLHTVYHHIVMHESGERSVLTISWGSIKT